MNAKTKDEKLNKTSAPSGRRANLALLRCLCALALAVVLLWATGFSVVALLRGPVESSVIQDEEQGAFVYRDIFSILGFFGEDARGDRVTGRYGMVPMGGKMVAVRFTDRYLDSAGTVCDNTYDYINGEIPKLVQYITVQGTVSRLTREQSKMMHDWYDQNRSQLVETGIIKDVEDDSQYLTEEVLLVDTVNGRSQTAVIALSVIAAALLAYMVLEMVLMACGFYLPWESKTRGAAAPETGEAAEAEAGAPAVLRRRKASLRVPDAGSKRRGPKPSALPEPVPRSWQRGSRQRKPRPASPIRHLPGRPRPARRQGVISKGSRRNGHGA